jgi:hypothetical protein
MYMSIQTARGVHSYCIHKYSVYEAPRKAARKQCAIDYIVTKLMRNIWTYTKSVWFYFSGEKSQIREEEEEE